MGINEFNENEISERNKETESGGTGSVGAGTETDKKDEAMSAMQGMKAYSSGEEKLTTEEDEMIASVKPEFKKIMRAQMDLIFMELISWTKQNLEFEKKVLLDHKSMKRCMKFCADKAMSLREPSDQEKAAARNNNIPIMTPVGSDMLFEWIKEYYDKDDKAEIEREQKSLATKKSASVKKESTKKEDVSKNQNKEPKKKKEVPTKLEKNQNKIVNGQISIFDLFDAQGGAI